MGGVKIPNYTYFTCSIPRKFWRMHKKLQVTEFLITQPIAQKKKIYTSIQDQSTINSTLNKKHCAPYTKGK